jgi:DEP domain-containing protein 5
MKGSHLRQVSTGSPDTIKDDSPNQSYDRDMGTVRSPITQDSALGKLRNKTCLLWVHDDKYSKDDVLFNTSIFPDGSVSTEDLVEVKAVAANSDIRDFQQIYDSKATGSGDEARSKDAASNAHNITSEKSAATTDPRPRQETTHDLEKHKHCIFVVKPLSPEVKAKHAGLQVCST